MEYDEALIAQARFVLVMEVGPQPGARFPLLMPVVTLGRELDNAIAIDDLQISRHHALLRISPGGSVLLEDLGSTNGTFSAGQRLVSLRRLQHGDAFTLADTVRFRLVVADTEELAPSAPPVAGPAAPAVETLLPPAAASKATVNAPNDGGGAPPRWLYFLVGVLLVLLALCLGLAAYLWFAPVSFWEWLVGVLGLSLP